MILQLFITDDEIRHFFEGVGYVCAQVDQAFRNFNRVKQQ